MIADPGIFKARRDRLVRQMGAGVAILPTAPEKVRNRDSHYPYRFDSTFYYLTGFDEPEAVLVLVGGIQPKSVLFCREKDLDREIWDGWRHGPEAAREAFVFDEAWPVTELDERLPELLADQPALWCALGEDSAWDNRLIGWLNVVRGRVRAGVTAPARIDDVRRLTDEMRLFKDGHELTVMRRAAAISAEAHVQAMRATRPGRMEYEIEAELLAAFRAGGSQYPAYTSIVAGGANACVLHYVTNRDRLKAGDLLLIDAGCELDGYAADITRTIPVSGRFEGPARDIYELVLAAQLAAIDVVRPGNTFDDPHQAALRVLVGGMIDLGLLRGSLDGNLETGDYRRFYMHRTGHWLGLDVHDVGEYRELDGDWRRLQPDMVTTVEPGCYVRPADDVPEAFWNIGVRIEDDVRVTADGHEVLTAATPKTVAAIEEAMRGD